MKKFLTKGAAAAFLIAASTSSVFAQQPQLDSTFSMGASIDPIFNMGNIFDKIIFDGRTHELSDKGCSFSIRVGPEFSFAITDQFKIGMKLFGQYNTSYTQGIKNEDKVEINSTGYAFGIKPEAEFSFFNGDDMSVGIALGPVLKYNQVDVEIGMKDNTGDDKKANEKSKSNYWSLDASIGLKMAYNISESLQLRGGVFYETANLAKFGNKVSSDNLNFDSIAVDDQEVKKASAQKENASAQDKKKGSAHFDSMSHSIVISLGLHFSM